MPRIEEAALLRVTGVSKSFGGVQALKRCTYEAKAGDVTGVIGPNGSGKTTSFNIITGLLSADEGSIEFDGVEIDRSPPWKRARMGLARSFQITRIFPEMTVFENMLVNASALDARVLGATAWRLLNMVGLDRLVDDYAGTLSYGQRKLLEIARVHVGNKKLILLDEPFAGVNRTLCNTIVDFLRAQVDNGVSYVIIDHEMSIVMEICDPIVVLDQGSVLMRGSADQVRDSDEVMEAYFGRPVL